MLQPAQPVSLLTCFQLPFHVSDTLYAHDAFITRDALKWQNATHTPVRGSASFYLVFTVCVICRQLREQQRVVRTLTGRQHIHLPPNKNKGTGIVIPVPSLYQWF